MAEHDERNACGRAASEDAGQTKEALAEKMILLWHMAAESRRPAAGDVFDPTRGKGRVLSILKIKDGVRTKDLAAALGMRVSSVNELLSKMEKAGLVRREQSEQDKRVMLVFLTDEGRAAQTGSGELDLLEGMSDEELEQLSRLLDKMMETARARVGEERYIQIVERWRHRKEMISRFEGGGFEPGPHAGMGDPRFDGVSLSRFPHRLSLL